MSHPMGAIHYDVKVWNIVLWLTVVSIWKQHKAGENYWNASAKLKQFAYENCIRKTESRLSQKWCLLLRIIIAERLNVIDIQTAPSGAIYEVLILRVNVAPQTSKSWDKHARWRMVSWVLLTRGTRWWRAWEGHLEWWAVQRWCRQSTSSSSSWDGLDIRALEK